MSLVSHAVSPKVSALLPAPEYNEIRGLHGTPAPSAPHPDRVAPGRSRWTLRCHRRVASSANPPANRDGESHRAATRIPHP